MSISFSLRSPSNVKHVFVNGGKYILLVPRDGKRQTEQIGSILPLYVSTR